MKTFKRRLASLLAAILLLGTLPAAALEEIRDEIETPPAVEDTVEGTQEPETPAVPEGPEVPEETEPSEGTELPEETEPAEGTEPPEETGTPVEPETPEETEPAALEGAVIYNLGTWNTAVLPAAMEEALEDEAVYEAAGAFMLETECRDLLFLDGEGGFAIPLPEDEPFFPYEVQFQYQGETWTEWFDDEDSAVTVDGYTFTLSLREGAEPIYIDGPEDEVRSWLAKEFTTDGDPASLISLQQLEIRSAWVEFSKKELEKEFTLKSLVELALSNSSGSGAPTVSDNTVVVWQVYNYDGSSINLDRDSKAAGRYVIGKGSDLVDIAAKMEEYKTSYIGYEFIVGKSGHDNSDQNDGEKYRIELSINCGNRYLTLRPYSAANERLSSSQRSYAEEYFYDRGTGQQLNKNNYYMNLYGSMWSGSEPVRLKFKPDSQLTQLLNNAGAGTAAKIYKGYYETPGAIPSDAEDVTSKILMSGSSSSESAWTSLEGYSVQLPSLNDWSYWDKVPKFTLVLEKNGVVEDVLLPFGIQFYSAYPWIDLDYELYDENGMGVAEREWKETGGYTTNYVMRNKNYPANGQYVFKLHLQNAEPNASVMDYVESITVNGSALSQAQIQSMFNEMYGEGGYKADFSGGVTFAIKYTSKYHDDPGGTETFTVKTIPSSVEPGGPVYDTFFEVNGASGYRGYVMKGKDDGYFKYGYQTVFVTDGSSAVNSDRIIPTFRTEAKSLQARTVKDASSVDQKLEGGSSIYFTPGQPVQYTAYVDETSSEHRNYWVTFNTKASGGAKLFVNGVTNADAGHLDNGQPTRLVVLNDARDYHDVFVANLGDAPMTGLYARLENAQNVVLDPYWSFRENTSLTAFPDYIYNDSYGYQQNVSKVRLLPEVDEATGLLKGGPISGTLVIGYGGGGAGKEVRVKLTGLAGDLQFTNQSLRTGVKWVPYVTAIQDNTMIDSENYEYTITGRLPRGLSTTPAGEIYGVPQEYGTFPLHVTLRYKGDVSTLLGGVGNLLSEEEKAALQRRLSCEGDIELNILNNTDVNVWTVPGEENYSYAVETPVGTDTGNYHFTVDSYEDRVFQSEGPYSEFVNFYLDGKLLTRDRDYTAEEGSTIITIKEQTFRNAGGGTHTIAAEFFPGGSKTDANVRSMKTTSQNYTLTIGGGTGPVDPGPSNPGGSSGGSSGSSSGTPGTVIPNTPSKGPSTPAKPVTPNKPAEPSLPFADVAKSSTFYDDIMWVFDSGLMIGTTDDTFAPGSSLTAAAIVTVLARMAKVDLDQYRNIKDSEIDASLWYAPAAIWAKRSGLLPEAGAAIFQAPLQREQMAVMLVKYMKLRGTEIPAPEEPVEFTDADQMSPEGKAAFQALYQCGVFKGTGSGLMDPSGVTNRGQFAALLHRVDGVLSENAETGR